MYLIINTDYLIKRDTVLYNATEFRHPNLSKLIEITKCTNKYTFVFVRIVSHVLPSVFIQIMFRLILSKSILFVKQDISPIKCQTFGERQKLKRNNM